MSGMHALRSIDPRAVDVAALARAGARLEGAWPLVELERLHSLVLDDVDGSSAMVAWSAVGAVRDVAGGEPELWLTLTASAPVRLQCQRCLQPLALTLSVERRLRFVRGEQEAARLDEESEDDVLELRARQDLRELVEDELILALPLVPRHDECPEPLRLPQGADEGGAKGDEAAAETAHPFAALAALRRRPS